MTKIKKYLNERRSTDLTADVTNAVSKAIDGWKKRNVDPLEGWPTRDEDLLKLANEMIDFFRGMKRASEQGIRSKN